MQVVFAYEKCHLEVNKFKWPIMLKLNHIEKDINDEIGAEEGLLKQRSSNIRNLKPLLFFMNACHYLILFLCVSVWLCGCMDVCMNTWVRVPMEIQKVFRSSGAWSQAVCELLKVGAGI